MSRGKEPAKKGVEMVKKKALATNKKAAASKVKHVKNSGDTRDAKTTQSLKAKGKKKATSSSVIVKKQTTAKPGQAHDAPTKKRSVKPGQERSEGTTSNVPSKPKKKKTIASDPVKKAALAGESARKEDASLTVEDAADGKRKRKMTSSAPDTSKAGAKNPKSGHVAKKAKLVATKPDKPAKPAQPAQPTPITDAVPQPRATGGLKLMHRKHFTTEVKPPPPHSEPSSILPSETYEVYACRYRTFEGACNGETHEGFLDL